MQEPTQAQVTPQSAAPGFEQFAGLLERPNDFASFGRVIQWTFTREQYEQAFGPWSPEGRNYMALGLLLLFTAAALLASAWAIGGVLVWFVNGSLGMIQLLGGVLILHAQANNARKHWQGRRAVREPHACTIGRDGFTIREAGLTATFRWLDFKQVGENEHFIVVGQSPGSSVLAIPKWALQGPHEGERLKAFIKQALDAQAAPQEAR